VLDRATGQHILTSEFVKTNWTRGVDAKGQPIPNPAKQPKLDGTLVTPNQGGAINWPSPSFNPDTGLFYANSARAWSVYYLYDADDKPEGWGGNDRSGFSEAMLQAIDYKTGKIRWTHKWPQWRRCAVGTAEHSRETALRGRSVYELCRARSRDGISAVARCAARVDDQWSDHV